MESESAPINEPIQLSTGRRKRVKKFFSSSSPAPEKDFLNIFIIFLLLRSLNVYLVLFPLRWASIRREETTKTNLNINPRCTVERRLKKKKSF